MGIIRRSFTANEAIAKFGSPPKYPLPASMVPDFSVDGFEDYVQEVGEYIAQAFLDTLKNNIETNKYKFENAASTIKQKGSAIPWIDTGELVNQIQRDGTFVGFPDKVHSDSGLFYEQLATILEYGVKDRGIPPRDVFRRTFRDFKKTAEKMFKDAFT